VKLISWNVNGLRACVQKGFLDQFHRLDADFFCLQETKMQPGQLELELPGYLQYWHSAEKKGYSGTAIFTKHVPLSVSYGLGEIEPDTEGRVITLEYPEFYLVNCYTPNAQRGLARIDYRMRWDEAFRQYLAGLDGKKPVILCGDLNVAHQQIDLKNPGSNRGNAGFSDQERESFTKTLSQGFTDTFRYLHPDAVGAYTWWSYMFNARQNNAGWRIDYFLVSDRVKEAVYATPIYNDILGSDHCPVGLEIDLSCNGSIWMEKTVLPVKEKEKPKEKIGGKTIAKMCALGLAALGLIVGIARIEPAASLQPGQSQTEPTATEAGIIHVNMDNQAPTWKKVDSAEFPYEADVGSEKLRFRMGFSPLLYEEGNFWIWLELNYSLAGADFNNARLTAEIAEDLCASAMAVQKSGTAQMNWRSCKVYREDGTPFGWLVTGTTERSIGIRVNISIGEGSWSRAFTTAPRFTDTQAEEMSTQALADYAAHLDIFQNAEGGVKFYREQAKEDPALAELEKRSDAGDWIAVLTDQNPELKSRDFLRSVFSQVEGVNLRRLTQAEANNVEIERLIWLVLQDRQLAEDILPLKPAERFTVWQNQYCAVYPAFRRVDRHGKNELLEYLYSYQGTQTQQMAAALYHFGTMLPNSGIYYNYKVQEAEYFLRLVTEEKAEKMTTAELVEQATSSFLSYSALYGGLDELFPGFSSSSSILYPLTYTSEEKHYNSILEEYALLREMECREDAVECLLSVAKKSINDSQRSSAWFFLRQHTYVEKMDPEQVQILIERELGDIDASEAVTAGLVRCVLRYVMPTVGPDWEGYRQAAKTYPVVAELERRTNAVEEILGYVNTLSSTRKSREYAVLILDREVYWNKMTADQSLMLQTLITAGITEEEAGAMTTEQLAETVLSLSDLLDAADKGYFYQGSTYFPSAYTDGQQKYAVIRELEKRSDAVTVLVGKLIPQSNMTRLRLMLQLLGLTQYQQKMTPGEAAVYVEYAAKYLWQRTLAEMSTNNFARKCLSMGFWVRELSDAETAEEAEAAYRRILQAFPYMEELESRTDFLEELLFFLDKSNLSVTAEQRESARVLLCLNPYYSWLTTEQQMRMAQLLLGVSFADGGGQTDITVNPMNIPLA